MDLIKRLIDWARRNKPGGGWRPTGLRRWVTEVLPSGKRVGRYAWSDDGGADNGQAERAERRRRGMDVDEE